MPASAYRFAGDFLAQAQGAWDIAHQNHGMLELNIDRLVPGGKEVLILSLANVTVPGREVPTAELPYLNGISKYPTRPSALGPMSATFRDFPQMGTRAVLHQWFQMVYNEDTGLMLPPAAMKSTGYLVLFSSNGLFERSARLEGVFPTKAPEIALDFANGEALLMQVDFSVDKIIWEASLFTPSPA